jgi:AraC-like DNA-binding protein
MKIDRQLAWIMRQSCPDVRFMGVTMFDPVWSQKMHQTDCCELIHIVRGNVEVITGVGRVRGRPGDILLIPTGLLHRDAFDLQAGLETLMVYINWPAEKTYFKLTDFRKLPSLAGSRKHEIANLLGQIKFDLAKGSITDRMVIRTRILSILMLILRDQHDTASVSTTRFDAGHGHRRRLLMEQARAYLNEHYAEAISLEQVAKALRISPFYLAHIFSQESDVSLFAYLTDLRMRKAHALLESGTANVSEAAYVVGYADSNYFSKVFRRHFGVPPKAVRGVETSTRPAL